MAEQDAGPIVISGIQDDVVSGRTVLQNAGYTCTDLVEDGTIGEPPNRVSKWKTTCEITPQE